MAISANLGGWIADTLVERGASVTTVRKVMQVQLRYSWDQVQILQYWRYCNYDHQTM